VQLPRRIELFRSTDKEHVMKKSTVFTIALAMLLSGAVALAQNTSPATPGGKAVMAQSMPLMVQMDEHMKKMQALHDKMMSATTPEERQKAADEARKEMQDGMAVMKPMMQGGGMMGGGMMAQKGKSSDTATQMQMMGKRMDMMQMMLQMMMDQQGMMAPPKVPAAPQK
jgi:gamma-glutamylcysteine synthetase